MELKREELDKIKTFMSAQLRDGMITQFTSQAILDKVEEELKKLPKMKNSAVDSQSK